MTARDNFLEKNISIFSPVQVKSLILAVRLDSIQERAIVCSQKMTGLFHMYSTLSTKFWTKSLTTIPTLSETFTLYPLQIIPRKPFYVSLSSSTCIILSKPWKNFIESYNQVAIFLSTYHFFTIIMLTKAITETTGALLLIPSNALPSRSVKVKSSASGFRLRLLLDSHHLGGTSFLFHLDSFSRRFFTKRVVTKYQDTLSI